MFGKLLANKLKGGKAELRKVENRDKMQAIVGGCLLVAASDGSIGDEELSVLDKLILNNDSLKHFGSEITETMQRFKGQLDANFKVGKLSILRELDDIKSNPDDAEEVFVNMIAIAEEDGEIDAKEIDTLKEVATRLGVRLESYGIS